MARYSLHPEALEEYADATNYYLSEASERIAEAFVNSVEAAIRDVLEAPTRWRVVEEPQIRRYVLQQFPFVLYYSWNPGQKLAVIYAVMHCSREPGCWRSRIGE
jgi:toxin ParE1/3/4